VALGCEIRQGATKTQGADIHESLPVPSPPRLAQIGTTPLQTVMRRSFETLVCRPYLSWRGFVAAGLSFDPPMNCRLCGCRYKESAL
jgi:hypothetical protein